MTFLKNFNVGYIFITFSMNRLIQLKLLLFVSEIVNVVAFYDNGKNESSIALVCFKLQNT